MMYEEHLQSTHQLLERASRYIVHKLKHAQSQVSQPTVIWSGGQTPPKLAPLLSESTEVDWGRVSFVMADERWVPLDDSDSNEGAWRRAIAGTPLCQASVFGLYRHSTTPNGAVEKLNPVLSKALAQDVVLSLLGMGTDGHFASLFTPADIEAAKGSNMSIATQEPASKRERLSLTITALFRAEENLLLCNSPSKVDVFARAKSQGSGSQLPVAHLLMRGAPPLRVLRVGTATHQG